MTKQSKQKRSRGSTSWEYFDDCLICQAMKEADEKGTSLNQEELLKTFTAQNILNEKKRKGDRI